MGKIEWAMWANEQAIASTLVLLIGGIISVASKFERWEIGAYSIALSCVILIIEYPRGKRIKGSTQQRRFQHFLTPIVSSLGPLGRNYYIRFVVYLLGSIPCGFLLSTMIGALALLISSIIYLKAAVASEKWYPCERPLPADKRMSLKKNQAPTEAPPRLRTAIPDASNDSDDEDTHFYDNITNKF